MSDRMDKDAMDKYYSYLKNYYPPTGYPLRHPYYSLPPHEDKDRKAQQSYSQMYGYPPSPYAPYQMPPMGYPQHYPMEHDQDKREEEKPKHQMPNPYANYYPYSPYPYYNPYAYPPYYYGQRDYANKGAPMPPMGMPAPHSQHSGHSMYSAVPPAEPAPPTMKILSKQPEKAVKQEIVISSDSEDAQQAPPPPPALAPPAPVVTAPPPPPQPVTTPPPVQASTSLASLIPLLKPTPPPPSSKPQRMQQQKPLQKKDADVVNIEDQGERDPFLIRKKQKIAKEEKVKHKALKPFPAPERERQINTRYAGMPAQTYQEMIKKQTRMRLELFYQRERQRKQQEKSKDHEKQKEKDILSKDIKTEKIEKDEKDEKKSAQDKSEKDKKEKQPTFINRISAPYSVPEELIKRERERIKDDHPLKELRYNESHGRIRLGAYFQSTIPTLLRHEEVLARKVDLQKKLRERQVAAVTF